MEYVVKEVKLIEEGKHVGKIVEVVERKTAKEFEYLDLVVEMNEGFRLRVGYPASVGMDSLLGKALRLFGASLEVNGKINPEDVFVGKGCSFLIQHKTTERGTFANIVRDSLKPVQ